MKIYRFLLVIILSVVFLSACSSYSATKLHDGYYTAEAEFFDTHGWKEFVTIYVSNNKIVTVEYNAKNASGFIKSWDMDYMRNMNKTSGTYPNKYTRSYAATLLSTQDPYKVDVISGATHSHPTFQRLADAAIAQAQVGGKSVVFVNFQED